MPAQKDRLLRAGQTSACEPLVVAEGSYSAHGFYNGGASQPGGRFPHRATRHQGSPSHAPRGGFSLPTRSVHGAARFASQARAAHQRPPAAPVISAVAGTKL